MTQVAEKRKYHNPTPMWVGVNIFDAEGKRTSIQVEPGGFIWLSPEEERMTAEAPVRPEDNPFAKVWDRVTGQDPNTGEMITVPEQGLLVLTNDPPRPIGSDRFIPGQQQAQASEPAAEEEDEAQGGDPEPVPEPPQTGAAPTPSAPPEQGVRAENEIVATPEAVAANDATKEAREPASPTPAPTPPPRAPVPPSAA